MNLPAHPQRLRIGEWLADRATGEITGPGGRQRLEPKVAELLFLLAARPSEAIARELLHQALWPDVVVGDDSLARAVFKLRAALGDDARAPRYIETLSKRGYRLLATVVPADPPAPASCDTATPELATAGDALRDRVPRKGLPRAWMAGAAVLLLGAAIFLHALSAPAPEEHGTTPRNLTGLADDFYFQFSRADNEAAIELYERALGLDPDDIQALSGLANALVQRSVRWPAPAGGSSTQFTRLGDALAHGHLTREPASVQLQRARHLAERALALAPDSAAAHKAAGFVASAQGRLEDALQAYHRALSIDPRNWGVLINIGDVLEIRGRASEALPWFERAYEAMTAAQARDPVQVRPWQAALGAAIAQRHAARGDWPVAEAWYRRVLSAWPLHPDATRGLAGLLRDAGDVQQAQRLCEGLAQRTDAVLPCPEPHPDHALESRREDPLRARPAR